ncbi:dihydroorotate dehydrogenase electron transfer subunit [Geomicrobium sp. JCM 19037]|uniref:dihydroorotate dehydrogenase electron transfer subunit n=1 Tax=Geomicrobium sp. JCM 19037 TaxID=1460634 RepID=UPI00045F2DA2|nr:dihydroorotate dehydrogenase electron transfer subunit [Geomicrobium sp. JCM 19037]GAK04642.1 dihydroorotate dehydrogenase electron transfer subunit [Geomicrobium sp. JCM 19037]
MHSKPMKVIRNREIAKDTYELILSGELVQHLHEAGTFLHVRVPEENFVLRRPLSLAAVNHELGTCTIIYKRVGDGTERITSARPNDRLDVLGPLGGSTFPVSLPKNADRILLVGGGVGIPPIYFAARQLTERGIPVSIIAGYADKESVFYEKAFYELPHSDVTIVTDDGSHGEKGTVIDILKKQPAADWLFACGPRGMLRALKEEVPDETNCYVSLEEHMGCGIGACYACICESSDRRSYFKVCQDGPVFRAEEVYL